MTAHPTVSPGSLLLHSIRKECPDAAGVGRDQIQSQVSKQCMQLECHEEVELSKVRGHLCLSWALIQAIRKIISKGK